MKKILILLISTLLITRASMAQNNQSVFFELGGNGIGLSVNYDVRFKKTEEKGFGFRAGLGYFPAINGGFIATPNIYTVPVAVNYLAGKAPHYFETGMGVTYGYFSGTASQLFLNSHFSGSFFAFIPNVAYRYAPSGKAFQARLSISPFVAANGGAALYGGISFGFKF